MKFTDSILKEIVHKCFVNASNLIDDATLLKVNNRKERAYALFQLSIEEVGKAMLTLWFLLENKYTSSSTDQFLKNFRDHKEKTKVSTKIDTLVLLLGQDFIKDKIQFLEDSNNESEKLNQLNNLKNFSLYVSFDNESFKLPNELITEEDLKRIYFRATTRLNAAKSFSGTFITHLKKVRNIYNANPDFNPEKFSISFWKNIN